MEYNIALLLYGNHKNNVIVMLENAEMVSTEYLIQII